ncbi:MAG: 16S rRNA (uracil(1498)-N(3))-methyltransferase [Ruminococcus flavefaciens]|nr:16S rRNA (uracil(1498)-N(3))-methyltransferase [Ruminococcus flavefaciens]MCM1228724.1 16S rRNA (uracil(1498)-N(3))-methyltransferase [Ruminococcus flavefaciens]
MPRFFVNEINEDNIVLTGENARHIGRSLRMRTGEEVTVCCNGNDYNCVISGFTEDSVFLELTEKIRCESEPSIEVTLFQAVPKLDKLEYIIQKSVELGVSHIVPVLTRRCISRPDGKDFAKKLPRLNKIAEEASKQSGRGIIPDVSEIISYKTALDKIKNIDRTVILYEAEGGKRFGDVSLSGISSAGLIIGSEGGFDKAEVQDAVSAGAEQVWLGKRILRCETAPISALSILMFLTNNM